MEDIGYDALCRSEKAPVLRRGFLNNFILEK
jgi:hypothetical protein